MVAARGASGLAGMTVVLLYGLILLSCAAVWGPRRVVSLPRRALPVAGQAGHTQDAGPLARGRGLVAKLLGQGRQSGATVEFLVTDVASLLRAGAAPAEAWWEGAHVRVDARGVPQRDVLQNQLDRSAPALGLRVGKAGKRAGMGAASQPGAQQAAGIVAGCAVAQQLGAPLAPVLESVARSVVLAEQGRTDRDTALAGPRSTARILGWLPVFGILLASALGADPLGFLLGGPVGIATAGVGVGLMLLGRKWISHLINHARQAGEVA